MRVRMSGGVGGVTGAIPLPRPDHRWRPATSLVGDVGGIEDRDQEIATPLATRDTSCGRLLVASKGRDQEIYTVGDTRHLLWERSPDRDCWGHRRSLYSDGWNQLPRNQAACNGFFYRDTPQAPAG